jgi:hypothetical protein
MIHTFLNLSASEFILLFFLFFRQLAHLLNAEDIFQSFSKILVMEEDLEFAKKMVQTLSTILLTSTELFGLRSQLKNLNSQVCIYLLVFILLLM